MTEKLLVQEPRSWVGLVWALLIAATVCSWLVGVETSASSSVGVAVLVVAFVKARLIGLHFMELRNAPIPLRLAFEGWCLVVCGTVVGMYVLA